MALLTAIELDYTIAVFQQLHAVDGMHINYESDALQVEIRQKEHRHHAARIDVAKLAECLSRYAKLCFIDIAKRIIQVLNLIKPRLDLVVQIFFQGLRDEPERSLQCSRT